MMRSQISGDIYVNNALSGLAEMVSCPIAIIGMEKLGRKKSTCALFLLAGCMCIASSVLTSYSASISGKLVIIHPPE